MFRHVDGTRVRAIFTFDDALGQNSQKPTFKVSVVRIDEKWDGAGNKWVIPRFNHHSHK